MITSGKTSLKTQKEYDVGLGALQSSPTAICGVRGAQPSGFVTKLLVN
jgi:hypothetical protein